MADEDLTGQRVLVVEDEYFLARELEVTLYEAGARVLGPVPSVEAAFDMLERDLPDVATLDINLNGVMAFPVADALLIRGVPFLFLTGYDRSALPKKYAAVRRLEKPVSAHIVVKELRRLSAALLASRRTG